MNQCEAKINLKWKLHFSATRKYSASMFARLHTHIVHVIYKAEYTVEHYAEILCQI